MRRGNPGCLRCASYLNCFAVLSGLPRTPTLRVLWGARNDGIFLHEELNFKDKVLWVRPCKIGKKKSISATL